MAPSTENPTIILVQGSFQLPDVYYNLADALKAFGYPVVQPVLPSLTDQDKLDFATKSLTDDALAVQFEIQRLVNEGMTVVVVMHSYGGLVGSEAVTKDLSFAQRRSSGLSGGVSFILSEGQSVLSVYGESPNNDNKPNGRFSIKNAAEKLYHDLPTSEAQYWESRIIDQSYAVKKTKITNEGYRFVPSTYVVCENDRGPSPQYQEMFGNTAGSKIERIASPHSPMLSHTAALADMISRTVRSAVERSAQD